MMASLAWMESTLQRLDRQGREVLQRACRHSPDWSHVASFQTPTSSGKDTQTPVMMPRRLSKLDEAFTKVAELTAQTTHHCQKYYNSGCLTNATDIEKKHVCRFHTRPRALGSRKQSHPEEVVGGTEEEVLIEVSPGLYAITARRPPLQEQTQVVRVQAGESATLAFNL